LLPYLKCQNIRGESIALTDVKHFENKNDFNSFRLQKHWGGLQAERKHTFNVITEKSSNEL